MNFHKDGPFLVVRLMLGPVRLLFFVISCGI